ncbi:MAG: response regulator, partial [Paracoccaceae bacterium]|nr:response regulator [Paracoccaceae bacterium]
MPTNPDHIPGFTPQDTPIRKVLVADDSRLQVRILSTMLARWGFEVLTAESGTEALDICAAEHPDLVLSDWMMPGMDGLELCRQFRDLPYDGYGYFILLTSKSEKGDIAQGLDAGADDFLTKPVNAHELRARINAGARILSMQRQLTEQNRIVSQTLAELQEIHAAIDKDLRQARTIQQSLVPERDRVFGTSRISLLLETCGHVGGDLVGMFSPGGDQLGFYNIDVSGHGITSAMVTARVAGYLSTKFPDQ